MLDQLRKKSVWQQEADERYATLTGRIRVLEGRLWTFRQWDNLLQARDQNSFMSCLANQYYPQGNNPLDILAMERLRVAAFVKKNNLDVFLTEILLLDRVYHNMIALLKYVLTEDAERLNKQSIPKSLASLLFPLAISDVHTDPGEAYVMGDKTVRAMVLEDEALLKLWQHVLYVVEKYQEVRASHNLCEAWLSGIPTHDFLKLDMDEWQHLAESDTFFWNHLSAGEQNDWLGFSLDESIGFVRFLDMPRFYTFALAEGVSSYRESKDIGAVTRAVYQIFYMHLHTLAHVSKEGLLLQYACLKSQLALEQAISRIDKLGLTEKTLLESWVPGGMWDKEEFLKQFNLQTEQKNSKDFLSHKQKYSSVARYHDELWHLWMKRSLDSLYGPSVLMSYYLAKQREIQNIRLIWQLQNEGFSADKIRTFLRKGLLDD